LNTGVKKVVQQGVITHAEVCNSDRHKHSRGRDAVANGSVRDVVGRWISDAFHAVEVAGEHRHGHSRRGHRRPTVNQGLMPGILAAAQIERLEDRTVLDADPYGAMGGMPGGMPGGTTTTSTSPPPGMTTITIPPTTTTGSTGSMTGGGTFGGTFLSNTSSFALRPNGQQWFETFGTDPIPCRVSLLCIVICRAGCR
jgi:hypothetical protein